MPPKRQPRRRENQKRDVRRNCEYCPTTRKICYSKRQARDAAADLRNRDRDNALMVYRCEHCLKYHIGHPPETFRQKPR